MAGGLGRRRLALALLLALLLPGVTAQSKGGPDDTFVIEVSNGGPQGAWALQDRCPSGTFATGFSTKVETYQGVTKDDTAVNGVRLFCTRGGREQQRETHPVQSQSGKWGEWSEPQWCSPGSYLESFSLRTEELRATPQDYMGATNIRFACSDGQVLEGGGLSWGEYGAWSPGCSKGLCGIQTRVESPRGPLRDDSGLNDARFSCCTR